MMTVTRTTERRGSAASGMTEQQPPPPPPCPSQSTPSQGERMPCGRLKTKYDEGWRRIVRNFTPS